MRIASLIEAPISLGRRIHIGKTMALMGASGSAMAQEQDISGVSKRVGEQLASVGTPLLIGLALVGAGLVGWGVFKLFMRKPGSQDSVGAAIGMIVGGSLMIVLGGVIKIMTMSTVGGDATGLNELDGGWD